MKILIADKFPEDKLAQLNALGHEVVYDPEASKANLPEKVGDAEVLVVRSTEVSAEAIAAAKCLSLIVRAGAGYNTINVAEASARGIYVSNCPGKNSVAVAELTIGLLLAMDRRIPHNTADLRAGQWNKKEYSKADGVKGKTLGIIGLGQIGEAVAARAKALEMNVIAWSRSLTPAKAAELGIGCRANAEEVCRDADVVTVHLAQTAQTKKMFNAALFGAMKPKAIFINTSRGGIVDQEALKRAMKEKGIRAALDVFDPEPEGGKAEFKDDLFAMPGFVGTHHIGASTDQAQDAIAQETIRIINEFATKGVVPNVVNIEQASPAKCAIVVRHYDKVGVLASVLEVIRAANINAEEMTNTIFQGAKAAVAVIRLSECPSQEVIDRLHAMKDTVIHVEVKGLK